MSPEIMAMLKKQVEEQLAQSVADVGTDIASEAAGDVQQQATKGIFDSIPDMSNLKSAAMNAQLQPIEHVVGNAPKIAQYQTSSISPYEEQYRKGLLQLLGGQ